MTRTSPREAKPEPRSARALRKRASPLGRPTAGQSLALRQNIIDSAHLLMQEHGYKNVSLDAIAKSAGVTKRTIYARFESKEGLLFAVLLWRARHVTANLIPAIPAGNSQEALEQLGRYLLAAILDKAAVANLRLIASEHRKLPALTKIAKKSLDQILISVEQAMRRALGDALNPEDARWAAQSFFTLISEPVVHQAYLGIVPGSQQALDEHVRRTAKLFLAYSRAGAGGQ